MRETGRMLCILLSAALAFTGCAAAETAEQGLEEIQPLLEAADVDGEEGMSLEEMTDAFAGSAMSEYADHATGFRMQYPSVFVFDEEAEGSFAATEDRKATLAIDNMENANELTEEALLEAIRFEQPDAVPRKNEQNGCLRVDWPADDRGILRTDLYFLTGKSFHHIIITYPQEEQETFSAYIEYMINTMETDDTDLG